MTSHQTPVDVPTQVRVAAVDLGATSGRVAVVEVGADRLDVHEVHRFPNAAVLVDGHWRWDIAALYREVLTGLQLAADSGPVDSIGIDSWAVDYGLLDQDGELIELPYSHRDDRTDGVRERVIATIGLHELYTVNGLQQLPFTTAYQLLSQRDSAAMSAAETMLLLPDLLTYWLTGQRGAEHTNASTTGLYDATKREWAWDLVAQLGLPADLLPPLTPTGTVLGTVTTPSLPALRDVPVVAVGTHDTASAVAAVPAADDPWAFLSSGTWSLIGVETPEPILTEEAADADFTNEAGLDGTVRFLKNVMGLWVLSECVAAWSEESSAHDDLLASLLDQAATAPPLRTIVDIEDERLLAPGDMPTRVLALAAEGGEPEPRTRAEVVRCVLDSLALAYRTRLRQAGQLSGLRPTTLHIIGGGSHNALLCQLTADACQIPVVAGPVEASTLGNALVQARALGVDIPNLRHMRELVRRTQPLTTFAPATGAGQLQDWGHAEQRTACRRSIDDGSVEL